MSYNRFMGAAKTATHTMPDGTVMPGTSHIGKGFGSEGYGSIFSQKNYWIGVVVGMASLYAYQKYIKK